MNIVIVGQGAMGLLWYAQLYLFNADKNNSSKKPINLSMRGSTEAQVTPIPFSFTDINNIPQDLPLNYANDKDIVQADIILLMVKSYQVKQALLTVKDLISSKALIVLCHNGMGTMHDIPQAIKEKNAIFTLLTTHASMRKKPLHAVHTGLGTSNLGLVSGECTTALSNKMVFLLNLALPPVIFHNNIIEKQWLKLAINCVINPLTALNQHKNGMINNKKYQAVINGVLTEIIQIAQCEGINLTLKTLQQLINNVAEATSNNTSSMLSDVIKKQKTEIDYINGYIHKLGIKHNIATPENTQLWQQVSAL
jgi:2-dehydropantoate 2-reductase